VRCVLRLLCSAALCLSSACATRPVRQPVVVPPTEPDTALGPGDSFEVSVYGQADLSGKYLVAEDGSINFPLVGRIEIAGKAPAAIATDIRTALLDKQILRNPNVSVFLLEHTSKQVSVMGSVAKPGRFALASGMTVIEAITAAGGLTQLASGNSTIVTRHHDGKLQRFKVAVDRISEGQEQDFKLQDGDIVFVPERIF